VQLVGHLYIHTFARENEKKNEKNENNPYVCLPCMRGRYVHDKHTFEQQGNVMNVKFFLCKT